MKNFKYQNPTKILFGEGQIANLKDEIPKESRVLMLYGGGSIKNNGIYDNVKDALQDYTIVEFGGVPANPEYEILMEAVTLMREKSLDYILAVGGGSVIDGAKFISAAKKYQGENPWDLLARKEEVKDAVPFATVLTLPASGSEMNSGAVISRRMTKEKLSFSSPLLFPKASVLDPTVIHSLPKRQIVNGIVDAYNHVLEQYMTYPVGATLQDRFAEGILSTLIEVAPNILDNKADYESNANFMWSCTMALNGLISQGVPTDWAIHMIGHELTALFRIDHACTLAIIGMPHYRYNFETKKDKLAQYGERVLGITKGDIEEKARKAIEKTEDFYHSLGVKTKLSEYTDMYEGAAENIQKRFKDRCWEGIGEHCTLSPEDVCEIVKMSY